MTITSLSPILVCFILEHFHSRPFHYEIIGNPMEYKSDEMVNKNTDASTIILTTSRSTALPAK